MGACGKFAAACILGMLGSLSQGAAGAAELADIFHPPLMQQSPAYAGRFSCRDPITP